MVGTENLNGGHHVVQFYGHDEELAGTVTGYLLEAVNRGGVSIVIATAAHRRDFAERLTRAGADLAGARQAGRYLAMDAAETLHQLMPGGQLDEAAFDRVIGGLVRQAGAGGRPVRAFGEMVALLWDDGLVNAAVQLEELWEELGRRHPFSLLCGYRSESVMRDGSLDAFAEVCRLHQEILGPPAASAPGAPAAVRMFGCSRDAPGAARHFAVATLSGWDAGDLADDVALVVTELAANAVVHARSEFTVILAAQGDRVRISVRDISPLPAEGASALAPAPLHGLGAVNALASRWGVESLGHGGKTVWVELLR